MATKPTNDFSWTEPESAANTDYQPIYPFNNITATPSGHTFEMDDTPTRERVRLQHRSGTFIEMHPNGDEVHKVYGDGYEITIGGKNVKIQGACNIEIDGTANINIIKDLNLQVGGDFTLDVAGSMYARARGIDGMTLLSDQDMVIHANPDYGGALRLNTGDHLYVVGDLTVAGSITADVITAESRVGTGVLGGVSAGAAGFTSPTGGLSLGIPSPETPIAVPGSIFTTGIINSALSVNAPLGVFPTMTSVLMHDVINEGIFASHIHEAPTGPTSPPLSQMF
jgi:hypothetical protein